MVMAVHQSGGPMPHYFFHLAFGTRTLLDEEGIELPDRSAARAEALAVIRELSEAPTGGNSRRRAGWFLQLADEQGQFFRTPIGHPALELATPPRPAEERPLNPASSEARETRYSNFPEIRRMQVFLAPFQYRESVARGPFPLSLQ